MAARWASRHLQRGTCHVFLFCLYVFFVFFVCLKTFFYILVSVAFF